MPISADVSNTSLKEEKTLEAEKKTEKPVTVLPTQADEPAIQETSFCKYLRAKVMTVIKFYVQIQWSLLK